MLAVAVDALSSSSIAIATAIEDHSEHCDYDDEDRDVVATLESQLHKDDVFDWCTNVLFPLMMRALQEEIRNVNCESKKMRRSDCPTVVHVTSQLARLWL